jgi:hypothetical protein
LTLAKLSVPFIYIVVLVLVWYIYISRLVLNFWKCKFTHFCAVEKIVVRHSRKNDEMVVVFYRAVATLATSKRGENRQHKNSFSSRWFICLQHHLWTLIFFLSSKARHENNFFSPKIIAFKKRKKNIWNSIIWYCDLGHFLIDPSL